MSVAAYVTLYGKKGSQNLTFGGHVDSRVYATAVLNLFVAATNQEWHSPIKKHVHWNIKIFKK